MTDINVVLEMNETILERIHHVNNMFNSLPGYEPSWWWTAVTYIDYDVSYRIEGDIIVIDFVFDHSVEHVLDTQKLPLELLLNGSDEELLAYEKQESDRFALNRTLDSMSNILNSIKTLSREDRMFVADCIDQNRLDGYNVRNVAMEYIENKTADFDKELT